MQQEVRLIPMTTELYHEYFREYRHDPDLCLPGQPYVPYVYDPDRVERYIRRQRERKRITFAILAGDELAGELILKNIEPGKSATMGIALRNQTCKDRGIGTRAERLAIEYVFRDLDIPILYADTILTNKRSQHVLEKAGFRFLREEGDFRYYCIEREQKNQSRDVAFSVLP